VIQGIVGGCRAQIDQIFGSLDLEVLLAHRPARPGTKNTMISSKIIVLCLMVMSSFD
jgi:hypothetical protein